MKEGRYRKLHRQDNSCIRSLDNNIYNRTPSPAVVNLSFHLGLVDGATGFPIHLRTRITTVKYSPEETDMAALTGGL